MVRELWRKSCSCRGYLKLADLAKIGKETTILQSLKKKVAHICNHSGKAVIWMNAMLFAIIRGPKLTEQWLFELLGSPPLSRNSLSEGT